MPLKRSKLYRWERAVRLLVAVELAALGLMLRYGSPVVAEALGSGALVLLLSAGLGHRPLVLLRASLRSLNSTVGSALAETVQRFTSFL